MIQNSQIGSASAVCCITTVECGTRCRGYGKQVTWGCPALPIHNLLQYTEEEMRKNRIHIFVLLLVLSCSVSCSRIGAPSDEAIATDIKAKMFSEPALKSAAVDVSSKGGEVTLTGQVPDDAARLAAYKIASQAKGVTKVNDQLSVVTAQAAPEPVAPVYTPAPAPVAKPARKPKPAARPVKNAEDTPAAGAAPEAMAAPAPPPAPQPVTVTVPANSIVT